MAGKTIAPYQSVDKEYKLIRDTYHQPDVWTTLNGHTVQIYDRNKRNSDSDQATGLIADYLESGLNVAASQWWRIAHQTDSV